MPHSLFLGSRLATQDRLAKDSETDLPKFSEQMTLSQRALRSIRSTFSWRRLFSISRSDETSYPPNVLTHGDRENNELCFVKSHMYHGMADVIASLMGFAVIINSLQVFKILVSLHCSLRRRILVISSAVFYYNSGAYGSESPASLFDAHALIKSRLGNGKCMSSLNAYLLIAP